MRFNKNDWKTPNSYGEEYQKLPSAAGIYLLALCSFRRNKKTFKASVRHKVLYVGQSTNIANRIESHPVLRELKERFDKRLESYLGFDYVIVFFKEFKDSLRRIEAEYIQGFNPPYNIQGRRRGV